MIIIIIIIIIPKLYRTLWSKVDQQLASLVRIRGAILSGQFRKDMWSACRYPKLLSTL